MGWGSGSYIPGVYDKEVPGTYIIIGVTPPTLPTLMERGYLALPMELDWGLDDQVMEVTVSDYSENAKNIFGYEIGTSEMRYIDDAYKNAQTIYFYRTNSGEKAKGQYGTALCSGELGNQIKVVITEDPDNPNLPKATIQTVTENEEYNVVFRFCDDEGQIEVKVMKGEEDRTDYTDKVTVGKEGTTRNVKFKPEAEVGDYTIVAKYNGTELATQSLTIAPKPVTVEINEVEANKEYNVVYSGTVEENKIKIEVTKDSEDITSSSDVVTIGKSGTTRNVKLTETAESGTYKIIAKYDSEEKKSQEFTYTKPE